MKELVSVTVLIPARNEELDIGRCLGAVLAQDHPHDRMEIVVVDGGSTDATTSVAARVLRMGDIDWKILYNPAGTTPSNLNAGLAVASGDVLCRVDARSIVASEYVRLCAEVLEDRPDVAVTGGAQVAVARGDGALPVGIARALNNRYLMGFSRYRRGGGSGPSDTVYLGAFRVGQLRQEGGWDERLETNQDYDLNRRMSRYGEVWFDQRLVTGYLPRRSLVGLWHQYMRFGRWKVRYWGLTGDRPRPRQLALLVGAPGLLALGAVWALRVPRRRFPTSLALGMVAATVVERAGADEPRGDILSHGVAVVANATVALAWVTGAWFGLLGRDP